MTELAKLPLPWFLAPTMRAAQALLPGVVAVSKMVFPAKPASEAQPAAYAAYLPPRLRRPRTKRRPDGIIPVGVLLRLA
jgi:hypothetical protein